MLYGLLDIMGSLYETLQESKGKSSLCTFLGHSDSKSCKVHNDIHTAVMTLMLFALV